VAARRAAPDETRPLSKPAEVFVGECLAGDEGFVNQLLATTAAGVGLQLAQVMRVRVQGVDTTRGRVQLSMRWGGVVETIHRSYHAAVQVAGWTRLRTRRRRRERRASATRWEARAALAA